MNEQVKNSDNYIKRTPIPGLLLIEGPTYGDNRGFFREPLRINRLEEAIGGKFKFRQWNHSLSHPGVIRGIHAEGWNKVIYPVTGRVFIALVDIRPDSKTFGEVITMTIDTKTEHKALFIPEGVANSFCVLGREDVNYMYLVDAYYDGRDTKAIAFDDPDLKIPWPIKKPIVSDRDRNNPRLRDLFPDKFK